MKYWFFVYLLLLGSCTKELSVTDHSAAPSNIILPVAKGFDTFLIAKGTHFANNDSTTIKLVDTTSLQFTVVFDNTAIYKTVLPTNQTDVNKLYGFSDNGKHHHHYSARIGWAFYNNALRLFGYTYNDSIRTIQQITTVAINKPIQCGIIVESNRYVFTVDGVVLQMPRRASTPRGFGYKLFPYFGGDEPAPHNIKILIKEH